MTCDEAEILLHALLDGELDAGHARAVETHIATCPRCAAQLAAYRDLKKQMSAEKLSFPAPERLRLRIDAALPVQRRPDRRAILKGFALGSAASAIAASGLFVAVFRHDDAQRIQSELIAAHLRSLQAGHLTDVVSTDQHTVRPWFNGRLDMAPAVVDLGAQGFVLVGGRLDYLDGRAIAVIVYRRRAHVINLFVAPNPGGRPQGADIDTVQGFNIRQWSDHSLIYWAISDLGSDELADFGDRFERAASAG